MNMIPLCFAFAIAFIHVSKSPSMSSLGYPMLQLRTFIFSASSRSAFCLSMDSSASDQYFQFLFLACR